jgi:hypothetical protein
VILFGGDSKEKALPSASRRMAKGFFHSYAYAGEPATL